MFARKVTHWDKLGLGNGVKRGRKRSSLPVSKWETLVAKSGQDGRNDTNRAWTRGLDHGPKTETKLIVFMLGNSLQGNSEGMQDVCWYVSTFFPKAFFTECWIHLQWRRWRANQRRTCNGDRNSNTKAKSPLWSLWLKLEDVVFHVLIYRDEMDDILVGNKYLKHTY